MNEEVLSQDEINALLNDDDSNDEEAEEVQENEKNNGNNSKLEEELTEKEKDAIGEIGNISMGSAATALYSLLDETVEITAPEVELITFQNLIDEYERPCVVIDVEYIEGLEGSNLLVIEQQDAAIISDLMMGGDGSDPDDELNDLHLSAVSEAMNQMMGSASTSMSTIMEGDKVNISPPNADLLTLNNDEIKSRSFEPSQVIAKVEFNLTIGELIDSQIVQLMPLDFAKELVAYLTDPGTSSDTAEEKQSGSEAATAKDQNEANTETRTKQSQAGQQMQQPAQQPSQPQQQPVGQQLAASKSGAVNREEGVDVQSVEFSQLGEAQASQAQSKINLIKDVPLEVTVRLGKTKMLIKDILELGSGSVIELDKLAGETVDLLVNGKLIAKGEVVVIDENFGFRVTDIISPMERITNL
ncbi:flagellar motor switch phosphatase FliY [Sporohalobacter salinus]|uniref:flagellar motor switch phosphatase FliY n=1 Tax=Sporohalobacter salinus TaxID=1494606 RepID=UPI0019613985|nr:flagellar motor switch phosphatase FliY [Sporohalobacter salinus]MBM7623510.1 flagellar motor switch protein FliN/FliY [Sporohalobacter salinus]